MMPEEAGPTIEQSETVRFIDNEAGAILNLPTSENPVARVDDTEDLSLGRFLARPTLISTVAWSTSTVTGILGTLDPWSAFLNTAAIKKKLDNFAYLRGNLHVKFLINGTPFQYGALRWCYSPLDQERKVRTNVTTSLTSLIPYSQFPGVFITPQANAGGEMMLPFFWKKNWLDITSAITVAEMGLLTSVVYAPLRTAVAGGTTSVTMKVYAWMTDVQLMGSTSKLALQGDEYADGPVSLPASAIASVASTLTKVPIIGRFARATEIGAGAISKMAALFGYTNVPVIDNVHAFQPANAPHLASTQIGQPIQKLTVDPKQELSIDNSFHGLGDADELALSYLKKKESYFGVTSWSTADPTDALLFCARVNPQLDTNIQLDNASAVQVGTRSYQVPLSYFGKLFQYWRGDIKIRMKVVCTKYHKGRLKISYDPIGDISSTNPAENVVYTQILDIGEQDDVTLVIPYHQPEGWKRIDRTFATNWNLGSALAPREIYDNGSITIRVLNTLTAPASSTVNILFFVSGGDNFEYASPASTLATTEVLNNNINYPSFFNLQGEDNTDVITTELVVGTKAPLLAERFGVNMGECVASLRSLLHRQTLYCTKTMDDTATGVRSLYAFYKRMPASPGFDPLGAAVANKVLVASGTAPFNPVNMTPLTWVTTAFCGYRGSTNITLTPSANSANSVDRVHIYRSEFVPTASDYTVVKGQTLATGNALTKAFTYNNYRLVRIHGQEAVGGGAITATRTNGSIMFNFPNYNGNNFAIADSANYLLGTFGDETRNESVAVEIFGNVADLDPTDFSVSAFYGAGPDFQPIFFLCCPTVDYIAEAAAL
jgi:hypothetical protein